MVIVLLLMMYRRSDYGGVIKTVTIFVDMIIRPLYLWTNYIIHELNSEKWICPWNVSE